MTSGRRAGVLDPEFRTCPNAFTGSFTAFTIPPAPRNDLVQIFATGIPVNAVTGPNYTTFLSDGRPHEYLRLNVGDSDYADCQT